MAKGPRPPDYRKLIEELQKQASEDGHHTIISSAFDQQRQVIESPCRWKAALCTRRAGKSYAAGIYLFLTALANPKCNCLYIALDHKQAKNIMFKDIMMPLAEAHALKVRVNWNELTITLENGSIIRFMGLDANPSISNSVYGGKYKLCVIDECASFRYDLEDIVYRKLRPALADQRGSLLLIGTPDNVNEKNFFYQVTREDPENRPDGKAPKLAAWEVYRWSGLDNPHMHDQFLEDIHELTNLNPLIEDDPAFQQMYRGKWTTSEQAQVYAFAAAKRLGKEVTVTALPELPEGESYTYVAAVDFGWNDPSAIVIGAYNKHDPTLYILDCYKKDQLNASEFAEVIHDYQRDHGIRRTWADPAHKQMIMDINPRFQLHLLPAEKTVKNGQIALINSAFYLAQVKILDSEKTAPLVKELNELPWDQKALLLNGIYQEHPAYDNHLTDALLYLFRETRHYRARGRPEAAPDTSTPEYYANLLRQLARKRHANTKRPWFLRR